MSKLYSLWELICRFKYVVVMAFILLIVVVLDDNSLLNRHKRSVHMEQMRTEIERYKQEYAYADGRLRELENPAAVEKLAREKYFMKRDNEDLFVLVDELSEQPAEADSLQ
ncbi:MAG: septum formation initiator family protein [Bacteroidaceae bacterium]|nr:septum formation initiator family protein [Bacteroidaceae bacterium]MBQ2459379.1 septum formation initiator family protein [Bacteroidaceae bacterium]MBQ2518684.1 septum formation initiator family protein [Bacteroidaceae bacterium]